MRQALILFALLVSLSAMPIRSIAQYFEGVFDNDSTYDWGWCILGRSDNNYFVMGWSYSDNVGTYTTFDMVISRDGSNVISKNDIKIPGTFSVGPGNAGEIRQLADGGYLSPLDIQWRDTLTGHLYSAAGFVRFNGMGDTIFLKTYTDTSANFDLSGACAIMPDGGFIGGGARQVTAPTNYPGYIVRADSLGDTLWTHTYQYDTTQAATINNIIPLGDGRIVVGAQSTHYSFDGSESYLHNSPWFMVLDSGGNIIRDTVYGNIYGGGAAMYRDNLGGYIHFGTLDTFETDFVADFENFPFYVAHLDTNFRVDWITRLSFDSYYGKRYIWKIIQLMDGDFLAEGDAGDTTYGGALAWAAKIDRSGNILWNQYYVSDSSQDAYFRDVTELPNGNLVFVGATFNDTLPAWHDRQDAWIVGTDSNGCVLPGGCNPLTGDGVKPVTLPSQDEFKVYPNPTSGLVTFSYNAPDGGDITITVTDLLGEKIMEQQPGNTSGSITWNAANVAGGVYLYRASNAKGVIGMGKVVVLGK